MHGREIVVVRFPTYWVIAPSYIQGIYPENLRLYGYTVLHKNLPAQKEYVQKCEYRITAVLRFTKIQGKSLKCSFRLNMPQIAKINRKSSLCRRG